MATVLIEGYRCTRCSHEWKPRNMEQEPKVCPRCKSPYWNRLRRADMPGRREAATPQ